MAGAVLTVRFNLEEARKQLVESVKFVEAENPEDAYRSALRARNGLFHARRAWSDLMGRNAPQMPVTGAAGGRRDGHVEASLALSTALEAAAANPETAGGELEPFIMAAEEGFRQYLGYLKDEVGRRMRGGPLG